MPTKQEIIEEIRRGMERVERTFSGLSEDQLATKVHADTEHEGWSAQQILAHLAGRASTHDMIFQMADGQARQREGGFDVHHWNQQQVDARAEKSREELLAEFREVHERLIERVENLPDDMLETSVQMPNGERALGDVLKGSGGTHSITHAADVDETIAFTP